MRHRIRVFLIWSLSIVAVGGALVWLIPAMPATRNDVNQTRRYGPDRSAIVFVNENSEIGLALRWDEREYSPFASFDPLWFPAYVDIDVRDGAVDSFRFYVRTPIPRSEPSHWHPRKWGFHLCRQKSDATPFFEQQTMVGAPCWLVIAALSAYPVNVFFSGPVKRWFRRRRGLCVKCGYRLEGLPDPRCSECGTTF